MEETPLILTESVLLSGVKTTSKRVAEKLELAMHELSELDSIMRMAVATEARVAKTARKSERGAMVADRGCCGRAGVSRRGEFEEEGLQEVCMCGVEVVVRSEGSG